MIDSKKLIARAKDTLGLVLTPSQEAVIKAAELTSHLIVSSGNKTGSTAVASVLAYGAVLDGEHVVLVAPNQDHMRALMWREIRHRWPTGSGLPGDPFRGELELITGGRLSAITSRSKRSAERGTGTLYVVDDAEAVSDEAYEDILCDLGRGAKMVAFGRPLGGGWFERQVRVRLLDNAIDLPGVGVVQPPAGLRMSSFQAARHNILGLATREWIDELLRIAPEDYEPRVRGLPRRLS